MTNRGMITLTCKTGLWSGGAVAIFVRHWRKKRLMNSLWVPVTLTCSVCLYEAHYCAALQLQRHAFVFDIKQSLAGSDGA